MIDIPIELIVRNLDRVVLKLGYNQVIAQKFNK
jgi:hypothetical protein